MKTFATILALTTLVLSSVPAEAKKHRGRDNDTSRECKTIEVTGPARLGISAGQAQSRARTAALKLWRADVVKQLGGEGRAVGEPLLDRCDPVNISDKQQSCRYQRRACK